MKELFDIVSIDCSKKVTKGYSTSFSLAIKMLGRNIQNDIHSIYGFVRFADEIVDTFHEYDKETLLNEFERELNLSLERGISLNPILNSFQATVKKYDVDLAMIESFMKSMRTDLYKQEYTTQEELNEYVYGSADVVGLMCLKVFTDGNKAQFEELKGPAMRLGSAFQKVNFLRDLKADSEELNRIYFPQLVGAPLEEYNKKSIIEEIQADFEAAYEGIKKLPKSSKFGVYTAYKYYNKLFVKIMKSDIEVIKSSRIRISNPMKFALLTRSYLDYKMKLI